MSNVEKKVVEEKKVTVKINKMDINLSSFLFSFSETGKQVEMSDKDENYIKKAITQFNKAQTILQKYYNQK